MPALLATLAVVGVALLLAGRAAGFASERAVLAGDFDTQTYSFLVENQFPASVSAFLA